MAAQKPKDKVLCWALFVTRSRLNPPMGCGLGCVRAAAPQGHLGSIDGCQARHGASAMCLRVAMPKAFSV